MNAEFFLAGYMKTFKVIVPTIFSAIIELVRELVISNMQDKFEQDT